MTFVALEDGKVIPAVHASSSTDYTCRECGGRLRLRSAHRRQGEFVAAHFFHPAGDAGCSTGESEEHRWMKAMAFAKAKERWPDADIEYEGVVGDRRADILITFSKQANNPAAVTADTGLAIECQYKHETKDIQAVTTHYLNHGYGALWLKHEYFDESLDVSLDGAIYSGVAGILYFSASDREHNPRFGGELP